MREEFARLHLEGGRFDRPSLPVDILDELVAYQAIVIEVARELWRRDNPTRQRVPAHFERRLDLRLTRVEGGSAVPVLERQAAGELLPDHFERARDLISGAVDGAADESLSDVFPRNALRLFDSLGRRLHESERLTIVTPGGGRSRYTSAVRRWLVKRGGERYSDHATLLGWVSDLNTDGQHFKVRLLTGATLGGAYLPEQFAVLRDALADPPEEGQQIRLEASVEFSPDDAPVRLLGDVDVLALGSLDWVEQRLDELRELEDGWLDGEGKKPDAAALDTARMVLDEIEAAQLEQPRLFPSADGGLTGEWQRGAKRVVAEIAAEGALDVIVFDIGGGGDVSAEVEGTDPAQLIALLDQHVGRR